MEGWKGEGGVEEVREETRGTRAHTAADLFVADDVLTLLPSQRTQDQRRPRGDLFAIGAVVNDGPDHRHNASDDHACYRRREDQQIRTFDGSPDNIPFRVFVHIGQRENGSRHEDRATYCRSSRDTVKAPSFGFTVKRVKRVAHDSPRHNGRSNESV